MNPQVAYRVAVEFLRRVIAFKMFYGDTADRPGHFTNMLGSFLFVALPEPFHGELENVKCDHGLKAVEGHDVEATQMQG